MHNEENKTRNHSMGPRKGGGPAPDEKPKNFKNAISRLFKELEGFKKLIFIALVLACLGSVLSIFAPGKLSDLTDEISKGLAVNTANLEELMTKVTENINEDNFSSSVQDILAIDLSNENINEIMMSTSISDDDKLAFKNIIGKFRLATDKSELFDLLLEIPNDVLTRIIPTTTYKDSIITTDEKIMLLNTISLLSQGNTSDFNIPESIGKVLLDSIEVNGRVISSQDQIEFLRLMSDMDSNRTASELYGRIDKMPDSIQDIVKPVMNIDVVKGITLFLIILYICSAIFTYIESILMTTVSNKFAKKLRSKISTKINKLPLKYFDSHATGDILSRVTNDVDTIAQSMNQSLATLVSAITLLLGTLIMMFYTNWIMALTAIFSSLIGFSFMSIVLSKSQKYFVARQTELGNLNGHIEEVYSGLNVVKAYNSEKYSNDIFDKYNKKVYDANRKSQFLSGLMMPMMNFIGNFGYVAVCIVGALLAMNNHISFGVIVAFISYVRLFTSPLSQIAQALSSLQSTAAASERVFEFVDEEEMQDESDFSKKLDKSEVKGQIEFNNVEFTYPENDKPTIKNFNAKVNPGEKIAIVGPTGAGKTTMVNLLMKFYDISKGEIKIDGISTSELTRENIHSLFTMVLQDTWLFNGTIKENIIYNCNDVSDEKVEDVCKTVGLDHFIKTLPNGYNSYISDNDSVSSGQRQLLTIARGMIEDAPFLILDEATSNVDTRTEELVQRAMDKLTEGKTSFIIAHRLSTIKNADLILVMKDGNIIETGNHEELMKQGGFYSDLYNSQFEL